VSYSSVAVAQAWGYIGELKGKNEHPPLEAVTRELILQHVV
jgi:hypothetical protein